MTKRRMLDNDKAKVAIGSMRHRITLHARVLTPSSTGSVDYSETFSTVATVWAMLESVEGRGESLFDSTHVDPVGSVVQATHTFTIRYRTGLTQENWVGYGGNYYDILEIHNLNEFSQVLRLKCKLRGPSTYNINQA